MPPCRGIPLCAFLSCVCRVGPFPAGTEIQTMPSAGMDCPGHGSADTVQTGSGVGAPGQILGSWVLRACTPGEAFRHASLQVISEDRGKHAAPAGR